MRHKSIDHYAPQSSFFALDPRIKATAIIFFIVIVALLADVLPLIMAFLMVMCLLLLSNIPLFHYVRRYGIALPFILLAAVSLGIYNGLSYALIVALRITSCVLLVVLLSSSTPFFDLLRAAQHLRVPKLIVTLCMFMYRYLFVFSDEYHRMKIARKARAFSEGKHLFDRNAMKIISQGAGMLLVRSYERGVRIYDALLARGYDGTVRSPKRMQAGGMDYLFAANLLLFASYCLFVDWMVI